GSEAEARQQAAGSEAEARQQAAGSETEARLQPAGNETYARRRSRRSDLFGGKKRAGGKNAAPDKGVRFAEEVLDDFRKNVGRFRAETGGMLASRRDPRLIDVCHFDTYSENTTGTFYYDVESMSKVYREWKRLGYTTNGIYHSHPLGATRPSFHDISSALLHLRFFDLDYFYLPIFQNDRKGLYTMYFYVVRKQGEVLEVNLDYVLKANEEGYSYSPFARWKQVYPIRELDAYRDEINRSEESEEMKEDEEMKNTEAKNLSEAVSPAEDAAVSGAMADTAPYFDKVKDLYPPHVLDKVIISVGTGGARSALTNFARCGFKNFILIEADIVSESNIATQAVHISEIGRKKTEVIREEILDINPNAVVVCVDRFLDDSMSDEEFKGYMDLFPGKKPTDYLILGCTDNFEAQKRSSILALKYGTPYLAAMMYKSGAAAELIFVYPGVTESCPRCLLGSRFEKYENGFENDVDSSACPIFATERMNALKGYIALMLLMYHEAPGSIYDEMLDSVKDRNFVQIRLTPNVRDTLGISIFDRAFEQAKRYTFMDETVWIPQKPDHPSNGYAPCRLCGGTGHLEQLYMKWEDTRKDFTLIRP
ncbi:MAG: ThiF family adenylyltransferase, partial [Lachnospiraceae bacterium]|nr:ThiF family adenylyltransferase [Lachnospiraceae bacterium]